MSAVLALLVASAFTYTVSLLGGTMLLRVLGVKLYRSEEWFFGFVLGSASLSTIVFLLTAAHLAYSGVFIGLGLVIIAVALWRGAHRFSSSTLPTLPRVWQIGFLILYAAFALLYLETALVPETGADALAYHVALPARYLRLHHFPANTRNMMTMLSEGVELLFLFAYPLAKQSAGSMVHLLFVLATPFAMLSYARRIGHAQAGAAAALLFFAAPVVGRLATTGYIDVAVACYVFAVFYLLEIWRSEPANGTLIAAGLLAGFCFDAKYTAAIMAVYAAGYVLFRQLRSHKNWWRPTITVALCAAAMMSPYLIKNAVVTRNPLAPFANRYFPNPVMTITLEENYKRVMQHWNNVRLAEIPLEVTIGGGRLQGIIGPLFLLSPLALLALRIPAGRRLLMAGAVVGLPYFASIGTRFLVPALPFVALSLALALSQSKILLAALAVLHAVLSWPVIVPRYCNPDCWRLRNVQWRFVLRRVPPADLLRREVPDYEWGQTLEKYVPAGEPVFSFGGIQQAYQSREIIVAWQSAFAYRLRTSLFAPVLEELKPTLSRVFEFPAKSVRRIRVVQSGPATSDEWSVAEVHLYRQGAELPRAPDWRLQASHNSWDVQLAFDNNPVTSWTSGQPRSPGIWVQTDLGRWQIVDRVVVESSADQDRTDLRLEYESAPFHWETFAERPYISRQPPRPGLRRAATAYLKLNHVRWLSLEQSAPIADDMFTRQTDWGVTLVASDKGFRLYRLD